MTALLILDNASPVPANIAGFFGLDNFSDLIVRKQSIRQRLCSLSEKLGWGQPIVLDGAPLRANIRHRLEKIGHASRTAIYLPTYIHPASSEQELLEFFKKLACSLAPVAVVGPNEEREHEAHSSATKILVLKGDQISNLIGLLDDLESNTDISQAFNGLDVVESDIPLLDLRNTVQFLNAITSTFDVRHFNKVETEDRYTITKSSSNIIKLREEFDYFSLVPAEMKRFFVEPFHFAETPSGAQYKMERLFIPDFALQWLHNSVRQREFEQFVDHIFYFLRARPKKKIEFNLGRATAEKLYVAKVKNRVQALLELDGYKQISVYADIAFGGVTALLQRYLKSYERLAKSESNGELVIGHGDLCFSNILYSGVQGTLKLIDPRGASNIDDLYTDPWYDVCKLSHSIEGCYDYINSGQFGIEINQQGKPELQIRSPARTSEIQYFRKRCKTLGGQPRLIRLFEASLFISMTPLHIESPLKVMAFLLNADRILNEVNDDSAWDPA